MNKSIKIILSILAIFLISGAVFWSVKNRKQQKIEPAQNIVTENQNDGQKQKEQNNNTETIDTNDWKTYRNEKYGYETKYPKDWVINAKVAENITLDSPENEKNRRKIIAGSLYSEGYLPDITFSYYDSLSVEPENKANNLEAKTLEEFVKKNPLISNPEKIDSSEGEEWSVTRGGFGAYYTILYIHNGHFYQIMLENREKKSDLSGVENKILSTFQFVSK